MDFSLSKNFDKETWNNGLPSRDKVIKEAGTGRLGAVNVPAGPSASFFFPHDASPRVVHPEFQDIHAAAAESADIHSWPCF